MKSTPPEREELELQDLSEDDTDIVVDYKDLEIEMVNSSRKKFLNWSGFDD